MLRSRFLAVLVGSIVLSPAVSADGYEPQGKGFAPPPTFSWTGLYVGGIATYASADGQHCDDLNCSAFVYPALDLDGWLGGFTVGYNHQLANWVYGLELDWSWGDLSGSAPSTVSFGCVGTCDTALEWIGTIRGRLGYALDRLLVFGTLGVAISRYEASIGNPVPNATGSETATSFVAGGGIEYAFTQHWSAKAEYLYIRDLGDFFYDQVGFCGPVPAGSCFSRTDHIDQVRMGLNYRF